MTGNGEMVAAISAAVAGSEREHRLLLQSIVDTARVIFGAKASSIFLVSEEHGDLVFEAVSGEGEQVLVGRRFPATRGIAGWVLNARDALIVDDLSASTVFARDIAESTAYVPGGLMAVPLVHDDEALGVLEVLDPHPQARASIDELALLTLFASQASAALRIVQRNRYARRVLDGTGAEFGDLVSIVSALAGGTAERRRAGLRLIGSLHELLVDNQS
ncbi:GAF domain-containing protein [Streptosporangium sp. NPDC023963]|uniref:GAF domain-containing protein n=1 Tax=Streptosporangium sp. NPDC023963 TaxID=3155608 RepID=UPI0034171CDA